MFLSARFRPGAAARNASATQYTFIARTRPTSNAGQLSPATSLGATISMASVKAILTISHSRKPTAAVPALSDENFPVSPRANTAAGTSTASAPYSDGPSDVLLSGQQPRPASAATQPTAACPATTHQGDTGGFCSRSARASSALSGWTGVASSGSSGSGAILVVGMCRRCRP